MNTADTTTNAYIASGLSAANTYYWRVRPENTACSGDLSAVYQFTTGELVCTDYNSGDVPVEIPSEDVATVNSSLNIAENFNIESATVTLDISHTWVTDIAVKLISPSGTVIDLFSHKCGDADDVVATFDDGGTFLTCSGTPVIS